MGKKEDKKISLLKAFKEEGSLTTARIMEILCTTSKGTVNTYIKYLKSDGYEIKEESMPRAAKSYALEISDDICVGKSWKNVGSGRKKVQKAFG